MLITDQVATAPCTDPIQVRFPTFEAKPRDDGLVVMVAGWSAVTPPL